MSSSFRFPALLAGAVLAFASCSGSSTVPPSQTDSTQTDFSTITSAQSTSSADTSFPAPPYQVVDAPVSASSSLKMKLQTAAASAISTVPAFKSSFTFNGTVYPFSMVGTNPLTTSSATIVPAEIQPLTFVFPNGTAIDGTAPAQAVAASPIFHSTVFPTETGQFVDVMQRANFNKLATGYHVELGAPTVLPTIRIVVPGRFGKVGLFSNHTIGLVNFNFLFAVLQNIINARNFNPATLPMFVVGNVFEYIPPPKTFHHCCIIGFHFAQLQGVNGVLTFAYFAYNSPGIFVNQLEDITAASHEVAEWANDPFIGNLVPPWGLPQNPTVCFNTLLEVGDPIEFFNPSSYPVTLNGKTYHPQDIAFFSWFAHQVPSIALNHQYSYLRPPKLTAPPPPCH